MSTQQTISWLIKKKKIPKYLFSWAIGGILQGLKKRVRIIHGKRAIGVRAIEIRLYLTFWAALDLSTRFQLGKTTLIVVSADPSKAVPLSRRSL